MNESDATGTGELDLFSESGAPLNLEASVKWIGERGNFEVAPGRKSFSIPSRSTLEVILVPQTALQAGWAKLQVNGEWEKQVYLQVAREPTKAIDFEHYLESETELIPTEGLKNFSFPIYLFSGTRHITTAFSIVNLSASPSTVRFTLRPGNERTVQLQPGQLFAAYFERFWQLAFPAIFPLSFQATAEVKSDAPLAVTVLRTNQGLPLSGVASVAQPRSTDPIETALDAEFTLAVNQTALVRSENLRITFWNVPEDSRCPIDAICIQLGRATVALRVSKDDQNLGDVQVSTAQENSRVVVGGFTVRLIKVEPARVSTRNISISEYRATLLITR